MNKPKVISIVGLTASGKSAVGIELAKRLGGEVVSCDSRQIYLGLDIGTGKVTEEEMDGVPHHLLDIIALGEKFSVYQFQQRAFEIIDGILSRGRVPILVGGTGLYSRAVVENYCFDTKKKKERKYDVLQIALMPPKDWIAGRIAKRLDERIQQGMIEETEDLINQGVSKSWLRGLGLEYLWNVDLIDGKVSRAEYREWLCTRIIQYAKRQRTWFKKERATVFLENPDEFLAECTRLAKEFISNVRQ